MSQRNPTAYEREDTVLLGEFMNACGRAGASNSGLCISPSAGHDLLDAHYLKGAVLARLRGVKPPFEPGQILRLKKGERCGGWRQPEPQGKLTVARVYFNDAGRWTLTFKEIDQFDGEGRLRDRYPVEKFEAV